MLQASACRDTARKAGATGRKQETAKEFKILFSFKSTNDLHFNLGIRAPDSPSIITIMCLKECLLPANFILEHDLGDFIRIDWHYLKVTIR